MQITTDMVAVVTGATSANGRETALALLDHGASVVALARGVEGSKLGFRVAKEGEMYVTQPN